MMRVAILVVSTEHLAASLGLPLGADIIAARLGEKDGTLELKVADESLDVVEEGSRLPIVGVEVAGASTVQFVRWVY